MMIKVEKTELSNILPLRTLFLQEANRQIRYNACHERNWTDSYFLKIDDKTVGYGSIKGKDEVYERNAIFEFYIIPPFRKWAEFLFSELIKVSKADFIVCQSNVDLLTSMLYLFSKNINADVILFEDNSETQLSLPNAVFKKYDENTPVFEHTTEPVGDYVLEINGGIVATGGFLLHYNMPFADLYMEVKPSHRRKGLGSLMIQELKKVCYLSGRIPAARCNAENKASKATLNKGGLKLSGFMLTGEIG